MNNELFDLCKEVYEKTGLETGKWLVPRETEVRADLDKVIRYYESDVRSSITEDSYGKNWQAYALYTSDYLLEKLPHSIDTDGERNRTLNVTPTATGWFIGYFDQITRQFTYGLAADTPLKALLKLTLALAEAGELK